MRIAVLSDARLPTSDSFPGHGLGKVVLGFVDGLSRRDHCITLFCGPDSELAPSMIERRVTLATATDEAAIVDAIAVDVQRFDVVLDNTHQHELQYRVPCAKVVNVSHDREASPGRCAVFFGPRHAAFHGYRAELARLVTLGVSVPNIASLDVGEHIAYLSSFAPSKGPLIAREAARRAGVTLVMAGPTPPGPPAGATYVGPMSGVDKWEFLSVARALLFPAFREAAGLTLLEAQAVGCPAIVLDSGGAPDMVSDGETGFVVQDIPGIVAAINRISEIDRAHCKEWIREHHSFAGMIDGLESALVDAANGMVW